MDTPQSAEQLKGWVDYLNVAIQFLSGPAGVGIITNLVWVQVIEAWDHVLPEKMLKPGTRDVNKAMAITLAIPFAILTTMLFCGFTREIAILGMVGTPMGVGVSAFLDWKGWNLDRMFGQVEAPK